ncbi:MAG: RdgB/HAM1 family non-canonical purine NTP pyrophosphatase [Bacteroidetes bacterium]|nr:RdgB/HAM1 family non-canonical purine NTP pyrophosphatase [Bacteroidota bacterium]MCH8525261.1 RdgB/HAM1 family non-canonical purine NTP pyrophosphatase [Balneolales bacterium]
MTSSRKVVLATRNRDKLSEMQAVLADAGIELHAAFDFPGLEEVVEDGDSLEANALKKARYTFEITGLPSLADDTGLEVEALGGAPGVYSARYAGESATYAENVERLLYDLDRHERRQFQTVSRRAQFRTVIAYVSAEEELTFEGVCVGQITREIRGEGGFGYDPVFLPLGYQQTFAEMDAVEKNKISHRGRAIRSLLAYFNKKE